MNDLGCSSILLTLAAFVMSLIALIKVGSSDQAAFTRKLQEALAALTKEVEGLWKRIKALEKELDEVRAAKEGTDPGVAVLPAALPVNVETQKVAPLPPPVAAVAELPTPVPAVQAPSVPHPIVHPAAPSRGWSPGAALATASHLPPPLPEAAKPLAAVPAAPIPAAPAPVLQSQPVFAPMIQQEDGAAIPPPKAVPPPLPMAARPALRQVPPAEVVPQPKRNLEDFLGTQLFLKAGVAILVIGVVFAMGLVFQRLGPLGKLLMGYLGGLGMLAGGMFAERKPTYRTFGRAIIAGAWGILYFVTYAGGFIEAAKVFTPEPVGIVALLVAAAAAVGFSLRYRNEWTTTSAFLLIFLGLAMAAWDLEPTFNLTATAIVALAMAVLVWRTGWVRLLGLGLPATWVTLTFWIVRRPHAAGDPALLGTLVLCWAAFQLALLFFHSEEQREGWVGLSQIGNFLGGLGLCLYQTLDSGQPWLWPALFGAANLGVAWAYQRRGRRAMYLLAATEGLAALALVTPLRLGWKSHLVPVFRLVGLEMLLAGGVFLKEKYFRRIAYAAFAVTLLELLLLKLGQGAGTGRTLLLGTATAIWLLNAVLLRTLWRDACEDGADLDDGTYHEIPAAPYLFTVAGTLVLAILVWLEVPLQSQATAYAALALVWLGLGWLLGLRDAVIASPFLGTASLVCTFRALALLPGAAGENPERWLGAAISAGLLALATALLRRTPRPGIPATWAPIFLRLFGVLALLTLWALLLRELTDCWRALGFGLTALLLMAAAAAFRLKTLPVGSLATLAMALLVLALKPAAASGDLWHLSPRGWSLAGVAASAFCMEALVRLWPERLALGDHGLRFARRSTGLAGLVLLVLLTFLEVPRNWVAFILGAGSALQLGLGIWWSHRSRAAAAFALLCVTLFTLLMQPAALSPIWLHLTPQGWNLLAVALAAFLMETLVRFPASQRVLSERDREGALWFLSGTGMALSLILIWTEAPDPWVAPLMTLLATLLLVLGLLLGFREQVFGSMLTGLAGLGAAAVLGRSTHGDWLHLSTRAWNLGLLAGLSLGQELILRFWRKAWKWSESSFDWLAGSQSVKAAALLALMAFLEFEQVWLPGSLMAFAFLWMLWARKRPLVLHAWEAFGFALAGFAALAVALGLGALRPERLWFGVPERILCLSLGVVLAFLFQREVQLAAEEKGEDRIRLNELMELGIIPVATLVLTTLTLASFLWVECGLRRREELLPLSWGLVALLYFERGRSRKQAAWLLLGHGLLGLGLLHVLLVDMAQDALVRGLSLRLWAALPSLAMLVHVLLSWRRIHAGLALAEAARLRGAYLFSAHGLLAVLLLFELQRPWVLTAWALQALATLLYGVWRNQVPWLRAALLLALAAFGRGLFENFAHWDAFALGGENLVAIPVASAALLAGYIRLRLWNPRAEEDATSSEATALFEGRHRLPWFALQAILLFGFLWMEAAGTSLTVWATGYGFGMVGLGFLFRERVARLVGLGILSACTLKLFLWDLRGLQGLSRVASFIVLGIVLITVSFVYTRFKERIEKLL
jgi:hypothetical protein